VRAGRAALFHPAGDLLERADALAALENALARVRDGSPGRLLFIGGEAGVGKTVLLRRFFDRQADSTRIFWGACDALITPRPLGPFLDIAQATGGALQELVESAAKPHQVTTALLRELAARVTVVVLEDVHWADEATFDVLRLLGRRVGGVSALVLASYRDDELERTHPLRILLGELGTGETVGRLKIDPLSPEAVASLAELVGVDADALYQKTRGNPFFVTEALASGGVEIPSTIRDAVLARCARVSGEARMLLDAVAVVPSCVEPWLLEALVGETDCLDECLASGMLTAVSGGVVFRHEFARLAVEESLAPNRKVALHRRALAALSKPATGRPDPSRIAHHAEAAGDADAILEFATAAGELAAAQGAHLQAAEQYERVLRVGESLPLECRAELLARLSAERYLADAGEQALAAGEHALSCFRKLGDPTGVGRQLIRLSQLLRSGNRYEEAERAAFEAVALLERLPAGRDLAAAYANVGLSFVQRDAVTEVTEWTRKAIELAERLVGDTETVVRASMCLAECEVGTGAGPEGLRRFERSLELALEAGLVVQAARAYNFLGSSTVALRRFDLAHRYLEAGLEYTSEQGPERVRRRLLAWCARLDLEQGRWDQASARAASVLAVPRTNWRPRVVALVVLGLVRARRGDPGVWPLLDEASQLVAQATQLQPLAVVSVAQAEALWLQGDSTKVDAATMDAFAQALEVGEPWVLGELAAWRRRAGIQEETPAGVAEPYALQLAGDWERAAALWGEFGCPYDAALALADADDEDALRHALDELQRLGARPAADAVARRLRERGARRLPRGPRSATRENPANLTPRELEVLVLVAQGLHNREIAQRLFLSQRTVDRHVSALLRKLGARSRVGAAAEAHRLGIAGQDQ
jgi:DNA-binding CsgD family transcriptional regulator/tetratricopeptide (TPR) repeat protein